MIFYSFVSFTILTQDSSVIKNEERGLFVSDTDILGDIDTPNKHALVVKRRSMIILEVNMRKKVSYIFKIFLNVYYFNIRHTTIIMILYSFVSFNISGFQFSKFSGEACPERGKNFSAMKQREFWGAKFVHPITFTILPPLTWMP